MLPTTLTLVIGSLREGWEQVRIFKGLVIIAAAGAVSGCMSDVPLAGTLCIDQPQAHSGVMADVLLGCPVATAMPRPDLPAAFRNANPDFSLDPLRAGPAEVPAS